MEGRRRKGGQASIEIIVTVGVLLVILIIMGYVIFQRYARTTDLKIYVSGMRIVNSIADNINTVGSIGDGYSLDATLPYRMFSTEGYEVVFYRDEPTVFVHGGTFTRSRTIYFSAPISTNRVSCLLSECNNRCNSSETETCLLVNRTMGIRIVNRMSTIFLTQEHNLEQDGLKAEVAPFSGLNVSEDFMRIADNVSGYRSLIYLYQEGGENTTMYLVFNNNASGVVKMEFNDTIGGMTVVSSIADGELSRANKPEGVWNNEGGDYSGGIIRLDSGGVRICIKPDFSAVPATGLMWFNRGYTGVTLENNKVVCLTYP